MSDRAREIGGELDFYENETSHHDEGVRSHRHALEARGLPPQKDERKDNGECEQLTKLHPDVETDHVGDKAVRVETQCLQLGGETEPVDQSEDSNRCLGVGLEAEDRLESSQIIKRLVDDRKADDGVDDIGIDLDPEQNAR